MPKYTNFKLNRVQLIFTVAMVSLLIALGISSFFSSRKSLELAMQSQVASGQSSGIIITQRDVLLYGIRLNQWVHGEVPRKDVQAARDLLTQRLGTKDITNLSLGQKAVPGFLTVLWNADALIAQAPAGYLPTLMQKQYFTQTNPIIEVIVSEGNLLIDDYQNAVSQQIESYVNSQRSAALWTLYRLLAPFILGVPFIIWAVVRVRRRYKQQRLSSQKGLERLEAAKQDLSTAREVVASLRQENIEKSEIVSTVNHELRTPLTSIIGYIDILKDFSVTKDNKEFHKYLDVMDRNASVLLELIEDILSLSELDSRKVLTDTANIDLVNRCEKCISDLHLQIDSSNIKVSTHYDLKESYTVRGKDALLSQVFTNLISNAIKFSPKNSRIDITLTRTKSENLGDIVRVEVRDHGIGIPEKEIEQLFSNFFRASNASRNNIPGSGLGLAIVKRIIVLHGGEISVKSTEGEGTTMIVDLPFEVSPVEAMVMVQRQDVLERAIESLSQSPAERLAETAHDVGGAIGFYTFLHESKEVLDLSQWLENNPNAEQETVLSKKEALLRTLHASLARVKGEVIS